MSDLSNIYVHPSSYVDESTQIGYGTKIWHFCHVMRDAVIGTECILGQNTFVARGVHIGNGVKIQNNVSIYEGVTLEDDVFCGPSTVFTNVINPRSAIPRKDEFRPTLVERGASIGANSTIICGHTIGRYSFVAAGSVIAKDVPAYAFVAGMPARRVGWICRCGENLALENDQATCNLCGSKFAKSEGCLTLID